AIAGKIGNRRTVRNARPSRNVTRVWIPASAGMTFVSDRPIRSNETSSRHHGGAMLRTDSRDPHTAGNKKKRGTFAPRSVSSTLATGGGLLLVTAVGIALLDRGLEDVAERCARVGRAVLSHSLHLLGDLE